MPLIESPIEMGRDGADIVRELIVLCVSLLFFDKVMMHFNLLLFLRCM